MKNSERKLNTKTKRLKNLTNWSETRKRRFTNWRKGLRSWRSSSLSLIIRSKNWREKSVLERKKFRKWKTKPMIWTKNWRNSTQSIILWELLLRILTKNKQLWTNKLENKESILGLKISESNISKIVCTKLSSLFKIMTNWFNTLKNYSRILLLKILS